MFLSHDALDAGRARLVPKVCGEADRHVEIEGAPDLVVEVVSDASHRKYSERLPKVYFQSGISEYWLVDTRGEPLVFWIRRRGDDGFEPIGMEDDGF